MLFFQVVLFVVKVYTLWLHGVCHRLSKNVLKNNLLSIALTFQNFMVLNDTNTVLHINNECYLSGS